MNYYLGKKVTLNDLGGRVVFLNPTNYLSASVWKGRMPDGTLVLQRDGVHLDGAAIAAVCGSLLAVAYNKEEILHSIRDPNTDGLPNTFVEFNSGCEGMAFPSVEVPVLPKATKRNFSGGFIPRGKKYRRF